MKLVPADYPMVAPRYSEERSKTANRIGLGTKAQRESLGR
ncbi:MAG: MucR family transcriptional regulator [Proteobacteria bacterium]|nr:MucR family transcriptional regulator [Pseudomonadota bacterium]